MTLKRLYCRCLSYVKWNTVPDGRCCNGKSTLGQDSSSARNNKSLRLSGSQCSCRSVIVQKRGQIFGLTCRFNFEHQGSQFKFDSLGNRQPVQIPEHRCNAVIFPYAHHQHVPKCFVPFVVFLCSWLTHRRGSRYSSLASTQRWHLTQSWHSRLIGCDGYTKYDPPAEHAG